MTIWPIWCVATALNVAAFVLWYRAGYHAGYAKGFEDWRKENQ